MTDAEMKYDGRRDSAIHGWFGLSYSHYLVLPRSVLQVMPVEWQERFTACLDELREASKPMGPIADRYTVLLRGEKGRIVKDPLAEYRHSDLPDLEIPEATR